MTEGAVDDSFPEHGNEGLLRAIVTRSSEGMFAADRTGTIVFANPAVEDVLGRPPSELVGQNLSSLIPEDRPENRAVLEIVRAEGTDLDTVEIPVRQSTGDDRWVAVSMQSVQHQGRRLITGVVRDISTRRRREEESDRYRRILETIDDGVYVLDAAFNITHVNEAMTSMVGYSRDELIGAHSTILASEDTIEEAGRLTADLLESRRDAATLATELTTSEGDQVPIETRFSIYPFDDESYGQVGVVRDISERKEHEATLTALHDSTRELLGAETMPEVCTVVAEAATDVIDLSAAVVYLFDRDENLLRPAARSGDPPDASDSVPTIQPGDDVAWWAFVEDEPTVVDDAGDGDWANDGDLIVPLGDHGVYVVSPTGTGAFDSDTRTLVELLAASAEVALSRVEREITLQERDETLQGQNQRLRQLARVNAIIREIDQALVQADSLDDIRNEVCDRLVASDRFTFAWIGERDAESDELRPLAWAGDGRGYLDEISLAIGGDTTEPARRSAVNREPTIVQNVAADFRTEPWRKAALSWDFRSAVAVPLLHGDYRYGILSVYANRPSVVDDTVQTVFGELGETIANAMNAVEAKRALLTDNRVELEFHIPNPDSLLFRLARAADCQVRSNGFVFESDGTSRVFFTATGASPDRVQAVGDGFSGTEAIRMIAERDDRGAYEAAIAEGSVAEQLVEYGAEVRSIVADREGMRVMVELSNVGTVPSFVERVKTRFPDAALVGRSDIDQPKQTSIELQHEYENQLTDRQLEVLKVAYHSGFFSWPRESTGQDIAESLDVSQPTVNRHLRTAERKLFELLFTDG
jgi:PAS domain S-box-containing protein